MTPRWLLPTDARTFETQASGVALIVQENAHGEAYYRFAASEVAPAPEVAVQAAAPPLPEAEAHPH